MKNEVALAKTIQKLVSDPALRSRLGQNARQRVEQQFSRDLVLNNLLTFYQTQLGCSVNTDRPL